MLPPASLSPFSGRVIATLFALSLAACGGGSSGSSSGTSADSPAPTGTQAQGTGTTQVSPSPVDVQPPQSSAITVNGASVTAPPTTPPTSSTTTTATPTSQPTPTTEPTWSVTDLTSLLAATHKPKDMNDAGTIVGMTIDPNEAAVHSVIPYQDPFVLKNGQIASLGTLGGTYGSANAINSAGQIAGYSYVSSIGQTHAFFYESGALKDIGIFIGPGGSWAEAVNKSGQVAVYTNNGTYVYSNGGVTAIPGQQFLPASMNDSGQIAGTQLAVGSAAFYDGVTLISLGPLLPATYSMATGLNNAGQVIGDSYDTTGDTYQGFLYSDGAMHAITVPGMIQSYAASINNAGDVVGWTENADHQWRGFLYRNGDLIDLNTLPGIADSGWVLTEALKINNAGQILASGSLNGKQGYCLLTPPA